MTGGAAVRGVAVGAGGLAEAKALVRGAVAQVESALGVVEVVAVEITGGVGCSAGAAWLPGTPASYYWS